MGGKSNTNKGSIFAAYTGAQASRNKSQQTIKTRYSQPVQAQSYSGVSALSGSFDTTESKKSAKKQKIQPVAKIKANPVVYVGNVASRPLKRPVQAAESKKPNYGATVGIRQYLR